MTKGGVLGALATAAVAAAYLNLNRNIGRIEAELVADGTMAEIQSWDGQDVVRWMATNLQLLPWKPTYPASQYGAEHR